MLASTVLYLVVLNNTTANLSTSTVLNEWYRLLRENYHLPAVISQHISMETKLLHQLPKVSAGAERLGWIAVFRWKRVQNEYSAHIIANARDDSSIFLSGAVKN